MSLFTSAIRIADEFQLRQERFISGHLSDIPRRRLLSLSYLEPCCEDPISTSSSSNLGHSGSRPPADGHHLPHVIRQALPLRR